MKRHCHEHIRYSTSNHFKAADALPLANTAVDQIPFPFAGIMAIFSYFCLWHCWTHLSPGFSIPIIHNAWPSMRSWGRVWCLCLGVGREVCQGRTLSHPNFPKGGGSGYWERSVEGTTLPSTNSYPRGWGGWVFCNQSLVPKSTHTHQDHNQDSILSRTLTHLIAALLALLSNGLQRQSELAADSTTPSSPSPGFFCCAHLSTPSTEQGCSAVKYWVSCSVRKSSEVANSWDEFQNWYSRLPSSSSQLCEFFFFLRN